MHLKVKLGMAVAFALVGLACNASPEVEGIDLVKSVRIDRTKFDYFYALRVRGDHKSYSGSSFTVSSRSASTTVIKSAVQIGSIDADGFVRSSDVFVIRQDRTVNFDKGALVFTFAGTERLDGPPGAPRIGGVAFLELQGRSEHQGMLPTQQVDPVAGATTTLSASIDGATASAYFRLLSQTGVTIATGLLQRQPGLLRSYQGTTIAPNQEFRIAIDATAPGGQSLKWTSATLYKPRGFRLQIEPESALLRKGQSFSIALTVRSNAETGWRKIWLLAPEGFTGYTGPWDVLLAPGTTSTVTSLLTAPVNGVPYNLYTLGAAIADSYIASTDAAVSNVTLVVE